MLNDESINAKYKRFLRYISAVSMLQLLKTKLCIFDHVHQEEKRTRRQVRNNIAPRSWHLDCLMLVVGLTVRLDLESFWLLP